MPISVSSIHVFPVKSLGSIALSASEVTPRGFKFDRRLMLIDERQTFITQREAPRLATIWADIIGDEVELACADAPALRFPLEPATRATFRVQLFEDQEPTSAQLVSTAADAWLSTFLGCKVQLVYMPEQVARHCSPKYAEPWEIVGFADGFPFLLATEASLDDLNRRITLAGGSPVPMSRFRPNLVLKGTTAWEEDYWLHRTFSLGEVVFRAVKPCGRCVVTTTDQATGTVRGPEPLQTLATFRQWEDRVTFGVNLVPVSLGTVRVGDPFKLG